MHSTRKTALLLLVLLPFLAGTVWFARSWVVADAPNGAEAPSAAVPRATELEGEAAEVRGVRLVDPAPDQAETPALATVPGASRVEVDPDLDVPGVCRITVQLDRAPPEGMQLQLQELKRLDGPGSATVVTSSVDSGIVSYMTGDTTRTPLAQQVQVVEATRGEYAYVLSQGEIQHATGKLKATGPTARLEFEIADVVHVTGEVVGSLSGAMADLALSVGSKGARLSVPVRTDAAGRFAFDLPASGPIQVRPVWSDDWARQHLWSRAVLEPPIDPSSPSARYVIDEGLLRIVEDPPSPLLHGFRTTLRRRGDAEDSSRKQAVAPFAELLAHELYLPPGTYDLERKFGAKSSQTQQATLQADETCELVLDCSTIAVLALDVFIEQRDKRELRFRVRDAHGDVVEFERVRRPDDEPWVYREVVDPGTYTVEVELFRRGARFTEKAIAVWASEVVALPGARAPLRVFLP